jgi:hypothetical protein
MRYILMAFILSCTEVSISKVPELANDTQGLVPTDTSKPSEPAVEPSTEPMEGIGGYVHYYLRQVACPACMGETNEITLEFDARFHEKISDTYTRHVPVQGQCTQNVNEIVPVVSLMDFGSEIKATANGQTIHATKQRKGTTLTLGTQTLHILGMQSILSREKIIMSLLSLYLFTALIQSSLMNYGMLILLMPLLLLSIDLVQLLVDALWLK